jgi:hypothetical protein
MPRRCHTDMRSVAFQRKGVNFVDGQGPCACLRGKSGDISAPKCGESCGGGRRTSMGCTHRSRKPVEVNALVGNKRSSADAGVATSGTDGPCAPSGSRRAAVTVPLLSARGHPRRKRAPEHLPLSPMALPRIPVATQRASAPNQTLFRPSFQGRDGLVAL